MEKKEKTKPTKKRALLYYLVLAAIILIIAAVTIAVVFSVNKNDLTIEGPGQTQGNPNDNKPGNNGGNNGDDNKDDVKDTSSAYEFIVPVREVDMSKAHVFCYDKTLDRYCVHKGMDFSAAVGTEVLAAVDGTVVGITHKSSDLLYGDSVTIEHANGVKTVYKFIDVSDSLVVGTRVSRGDVIGSVAAANGVENADGDHLHFEVYKDGVETDPDDYLNIVTK